MHNITDDEGFALLAKALLALKDEADVNALLTDLCTIKEIQAMVQRIEVARMLRDHVKYNDISTRTGASTATISRVNRALTYGNDGYEMVAKRLDEMKAAGGQEDNI